MYVPNLGKAVMSWWSTPPYPISFKECCYNRFS